MHFANVVNVVSLHGGTELSARLTLWSRQLDRNYDATKRDIKFCPGFKTKVSVNVVAQSEQCHGETES